MKCVIAGILVLVGLLFLAGPGAFSQAPSAIPKLDPIAETKLLMEGLAQTNVRGAERLLTQRPTDQQTWTFLRGQALLLAETGNLLMLRPPKNTAAQTNWFARATELRQQATLLAQAAGQRDYERSRSALFSVAASCNRCHQAFRVSTHIQLFTESPLEKVRTER